MSQLPLHYHIADLIDMDKWPEHYNYCALQGNGTLALFVSPPVLKEHHKKENIHGHTGYYLKTERWTEYHWEGTLSIFYPIKIGFNKHFREMFFTREQIQQIKDNYSDDIQVQKDIVLEEKRKERAEKEKEEKKENFHATVLAVCIVSAFIIAIVGGVLQS